LAQKGASIVDSLTTDPVAAVLRRLYQEAERADRPLMERYRDRGVALDELLKAEAKDYRAVYRTYANNFLNVSADFGRFLYMCAYARKAKRIVEFGTSFGISTIHLACALRDGGGAFDREPAGAHQSKACSRKPE
jgi:predicted O-methyltransferase YrrM